MKPEPRGGLFFAIEVDEELLAVPARPGDRGSVHRPLQDGQAGAIKQDLVIDVETGDRAVPGRPVDPAAVYFYVGKFGHTGRVRIAANQMFCSEVRYRGKQRVENGSRSPGYEL
jgi:hypothetical protein